MIAPGTPPGPLLAHPHEDSPMRSRLLAAAAVLAAATTAPAADYGLTKGTPEIKSISALAFGPDGILFVGDPQSATIFAIDTGDKAAGSAAPINVDQVNAKLAGLLGVTPADVSVADLKVNPASGTAYLAVGRGKSAAGAAIVTVSRSG